MADVFGMGKSEADMVKSVRTTTTNGGTVGHRQRLRERFLSGESGVRTEEALLELLLTYAIPQQDVAPLARALLAKFGDLAGVLAADPSRLLEVKGIKDNSAALLKLVDAIQRTLAGDVFEEPHCRYAADGQLSLFNSSEAAVQAPEAAGMSTATAPERETVDVPASRQRGPKVKARAIAQCRGTEMFTTAFMRDAIELMPVQSIEEVLQRALVVAPTAAR